MISQKSKYVANIVFSILITMALHTIKSIQVEIFNFMKIFYIKSYLQ